MNLNDVLHTLIDLASGYKPSLSPDEAASLHDAVNGPDPGPDSEPAPDPAPTSVVPPAGGTEAAPPAGW